MSAQTRLPSIMTGKGRYPAAYLQPGEMIRLRGSAFVVKANAVITIQYEDGGWNILPMSAHIGKPLPDVLAWAADLDEVQAWFADKSRPRPMWRSLTRRS